MASTPLARLLKAPGYFYYRGRHISKIKNALFKLILFNCRGNNVPDALYIEPTNICNANCIFCAYQFDSRRKEVMPETSFKKAVDEYYKMGGRAIGLTPMVGEALVDPHVIEKIEYLREKGFRKVSLYTNLTLLHEFDTRRFLRSGITDLHVSTAPLSEELYARIYRNAKYRFVLNNLKDLLERFQSTGDKTLESIEISFRSDRLVKQCVEMSDYKEYVEPYLCDRISITAMTTYDGWNGAIKPSDLLEGMKIKSPDFSKRLPCTRLYIVQCAANGELRLCGCRYNPLMEEDELLLGDIRNDTIYRVYNSAKVRNIINGFLKNDLPQVCRKCSWYEI